jgi:hypothetical protein
LTVRNAEGKEVRRYTSADAPPRIDLASIPSAPEWVARPVTLATTPGLHRFVWPLRYATPPALSKGNVFADGIWAPPGRYTIELRVDGQAFTQPLEIAPDPRVSLPASTYTEQFQFAREIEAARIRVAEALADTTRLQSALTAKLAGADATTAKLLGDFQERLSAVTGVVTVSNPSNGWWLPPKTLTSLRYLTTTLDALQHAVDDVDAAPSPDARTGFAKIAALIDPTLAAWEKVKTEDLSALNAGLARTGQAAVSPGK